MLKHIIGQSLYQIIILMCIIIDSLIISFFIIIIIVYVAFIMLMSLNEVAFIWINKENMRIKFKNSKKLNNY